MRATIDQAPVALSTKEFLLLRFLAVNAERTVTRAEVLDDVWGTVHNIDPTIVDQYVKYLRRKLESAGAEVSIRTVRGVGYELRIGGRE
jgi:two-component system OmpR family response regulator